MSAEVMMDEIWGWLPKCNAVQLVELCSELSVPVLEDRKGDRRAVFNIVNRHLTSPDFEDPATGLPIFTQVHGLLRQMFADDKTTVKVEVSTAAVEAHGGGNSSGNLKNAASVPTGQSGVAASPHSCSTSN